MKITQINNIWSKCDKSDIPALREFLSYEAEYWERNRWGKKRVTYLRSFVGKYNGFFFTGFIPMIVEHFPEADINTKPPKPFKIEIQNSLGGKILRPYQKKLLMAALTQRRGALKAPTGSGKTLVEASVIKSIISAKSLVIVHTKSLLSQMKKELYKLLQVPIGIIGDGKEDWQNVTVGMIQTLSKMRKQYLLEQEFDILIVDEAHHALAKTYQHVLSSIDAEYRLGFSATPKDFEDPKGEYMKVTGLLGPIIKTVSYDEVKDVLAKPEVRIIQYEPDYKLEAKLDGANWHKTYRLGIEDNINRNKAICKSISGFDSNVSVLIMVKTIKHGEILSEMLPQAEFVCGRDNTQTRERIRNALNKNKCVIATAVFGEGVDIPKLDVLVNAGAGLSKIQTIQRAGRVLRKSENKKIGIIIDFYDDSSRFLIKHSMERISIYKKLGWLDE